MRSIQEMRREENEEKELENAKYKVGDFFKRRSEMREIKFKIQIDGENWEVLSLKEIIELSLEGNDISNCNIRQYTEVKDKNGTEIYEGDILLEEDDERVEKGYALFDDGGFVIQLEKYQYLLGRGTAYRYKVIGNIHNNPELIKDKKDEH